jgi:hypothetical protein
VADGTAKDEAATDVRLREELLILEEKVFRFQLEYYKQHYSQFGEEYWWAWACRLGNRSSSRLPVPSNLKAFAPGQPERQIKLIREAVDAFVNPPDRPNWYPVSRLMTLLVIPEQLRPMFAGEKPDYRVLYDAESEAKFCEYLQELSKHKDPIVRFMAHDGLDNLYSYSQRKEKEYFLNRMRMHPVFLRV